MPIERVLQPSLPPGILEEVTTILIQDWIRHDMALAPADLSPQDFLALVYHGAKIYIQREKHLTDLQNRGATEQEIQLCQRVFEVVRRDFMDNSPGPKRMLSRDFSTKLFIYAQQFLLGLGIPPTPRLRKELLDLFSGADYRLPVV